MIPSGAALGGGREYFTDSTTGICRWTRLNVIVFGVVGRAWPKQGTWLELANAKGEEIVGLVALIAHDGNDAAEYLACQNESCSRK